MKHIRKFYLLLGVLLCLGLAACGSDDDGDGGGGGNSNPIVGTWRLSELKTDAWIDYTDGSESQHSISTKTYGMKNGVWENTYTFNGDGSYKYSYLDGSKIYSQTGYFTFYGSQITLSGETYNVSISGDVMNWSHEASRKEMHGMISGMYYKMEYATWYRVN